MHHFSKNLTQIIFFDLEFYVPVQDRVADSRTFRANPFQPGHKLLGGTFLRSFPLLGDEPETTKHWLWSRKDEEDLLRSIYDYFVKCWELSLMEAEQCDLIISGIGVGRADLGYLYSKCLEHKIAPPEDLFKVFYHLRILDLEQIAVPYFKSKLRMLYPKTTGELLSKFQIDTKRESGTGVWEMFDEADYSSIEARNHKEVEDAYTIFTEVLARIRLNNISPKYRVDSIRRVTKQIQSKEEEAKFLACFEWNGEEERYIVIDSEETRLTILHFFDKYRYWDKRR